MHPKFCPDRKARSKTETARNANERPALPPRACARDRARTLAARGTPLEARTRRQPASCKKVGALSTAHLRHAAPV